MAGLQQSSPLQNLVTPNLDPQEPDPSNPDRPNPDLQESDADNFKWLNRARRGPSYTSYSQYSHLPYCSFEWGEHGYAGSCSHGGELLYLAQPSEKTGLLIVRGHFATSLYASLSRSQTDFGGPSTFGLEVTRYPFAYDADGDKITLKQLEEQAKSTKKDRSGVSNGSSFALGRMIDRGCFNYRYPVTEYYLQLHPYQQAIEDRKSEQKAAEEEVLERARRRPSERLNREPTQASTLNTILEGPEDAVVGGNEVQGDQQQLQNRPVEGTSNGATDPNGNSHHTQTPGQADTTVDETTHPQSPEPNGLVTESPVVQKTDDKDEDDETEGKVVGTCQMFSCSMGKRFYQILRIEELRASDKDDFDMSFPPDSQIVLTMGGPVWFQSFNDGDHDLVLGIGTRIPSSHQKRRKSKVANTDDAGEPEEKVIDLHERKTTTNTLAYWVKNKDKEDEKGNKVVDNGGRGLEAQIYQYDPTMNHNMGGYRQRELIKSTWEADNGPDKTGLTAYNAICPLKPESDPVGTRLGQCKQPRSATFLAVIELYEGEARLGGWSDEPPLPQVFYEHIAVDHLHKNATSAMWERIFLDPRCRGAGLEPVINLTEFNMLGRSLEKILQVDMIPATFKDDTLEEAHDPDGTHERKYLALVSNLFIKANVDLKAMFWKIRFLIRVHKFLSYIHEPSPGGSKGKDKEQDIGNPEGPGNPEILQQGEQEEVEEERDPIEKAQNECIEHQMSRIKSAIERIVHYLAKALLEPTLDGTTGTSMMPDHKVAGESNYYYVMMTIWYVWKYFHGVDSSWTFEWVNKLGRRSANSILLGPCRLPPDEWTFAPSDRDKVQLLQWLHYGSLLKLCHKDVGVLNSSWKSHDLEYKVRKLANAAKMVSSAKLSSNEPYVADDEIFDRLSFVSDELELENVDPKDNGVVALLSMNRVKGRDYTRTLNPGWLPSNVEGSTSGPWEIHALCHHSRLVVLTKEEKTQRSFRTREHTHSEAEGFRQNICNFLNAEGTLIPCWERAHAIYRKGWLRSEATCVVSTTLVIILERIAELAAEDALVAKGTLADKDSSTEPPEIQATIEWAQHLSKFAEKSNGNEKRIIQEVIHLNDLMKGQLDAFERFTNESGQQPPVVWKSFRPPVTYHPSSFTNSIEDKPEMYKYQILRKLRMPLSLNDDMIDRPETIGAKKRDFEKNDIDKIFSDSEIRDLIFIVDIKAARNEEDNDGFTWVIKDYQYKDFADCTDVKKREKEVKDNTEALEWALYDSLVDQEVQHRIHTVKPLRPKNAPVKIPREILELLVYVAHPESAACLGDHSRDILNFSRFSCQTGDTWVASITLRSWRVHDTHDIHRPRHDAPTNPKHQNSADDFYLPTNLMQVWEKVEGLNERTIFKPEAASIILSTNSFGDFSKCTIVAEFFDAKKMNILAKKARKLWQRFIHQPQTARCLVFFLLLGSMCEALTEQYTTAIKKLAELLTLDGTFTKTVEDYPQKYELGVWSLDALHKLQSSLNATVASLYKAKNDLTAQISSGPGQRSVKLQRMCQDYMSKFEDNLVQLIAVNVELNRRIELNTRNKDATSAILTMRDSRTAISQNSTVQRLTYLTIGYLPIALMAAIFAIPDTTNVLYLPAMAHHGRAWFVGSILIISIFTWTLAIYIGAILKFLQNFFRYPPPVPGGGPSKSKKKDSNKAPLNFFGEIINGSKWMWDNWVVGGWKEDEVKGGKKKEEKEKKRRFAWVIDNWFIGDWLDKGDTKAKEMEKKQKDKKGGFQWIGGRWSKTERAVETVPTNVDSAAEQGLMNGGDGSGKRSSTDASEPLAKETEVPTAEPLSDLQGN